MDEETKRHLDAMEARLTARMEAMEVRLTARMDDDSERALNRLTSLEQDFQNTKGFLVGDALVSSRR